MPVFGASTEVVEHLAKRYEEQDKWNDVFSTKLIMLLDNIDGLKAEIRKRLREAESAALTESELSELALRAGVLRDEFEGGVARINELTASAEAIEQKLTETFALASTARQSLVDATALANLAREQNLEAQNSLECSLAESKTSRIILKQAESKAKHAEAQYESSAKMNDAATLTLKLARESETKAAKSLEEATRTQANAAHALEVSKEKLSEAKSSLDNSRESLDAAKQSMRVTSRNLIYVFTASCVILLSSSALILPPPMWRILVPLGSSGAAVIAGILVGRRAVHESSI